ncbi:MAG: tyrosine-type recombinase/integrase [Planctomycetota bacterium]
MRVARPTYCRSGRRRKSARWHVHVKDHRGEWRRLPAFTDKGASEKLARRVEKLAALRAVGAAPDEELAAWLENIATEHREKLREWGLLSEGARAITEPLKDHVGDWHAHLLAKGDTPEQAKLVRNRVLKVLKRCGFTYWTDVHGGTVEKWLADRRKAPRLDDDDRVLDRKMSTRTSNFHLAALKAFCSWMKEEGRAGASPLARVKPVPVTDQQDRGALTAEQVRKLIDETRRQNVERCGMDAWTRCMVYRLAADTAQRYGALASLTSASFTADHEGDLLMHVEAKHMKARRSYDVPLRPALAADVRRLIARTPAGRPLFRLKRGHGAAMLRADLEAAGLPTIDETGARLVFHSFRHTATTWLLEAGVSEQATMTITGHKTRAMLDRYGHRRRSEAKKALRQLPELRMTGTDDKPAACRGVAPEPVAEKNLVASVASCHVDTGDGAGETAFSHRWGGRAAEGAGLENR